MCFDGIRKGKNFNFSFSRASKKCLKQMIKRTFIALKIIFGGIIYRIEIK